MVEGKKKVLIFIDRWSSGGIESFILTFLENSNSEQYEFTILTSYKESNLFDERLDNLGVEFVVLLDSFYKWYMRPLKMFIEFTKFNKKNKFDVYHFNIYNALSMVFPTVVKNKSKIIIHSHNADVAHDKTRFIKLATHKIARKMFLKNNYELIAVSNLAGKWMFGKKNFSIINNGINKDKFLFNNNVRNEYREKFKISEDTLVLLNVGRLNEQKNQALFIQVLKYIKQYSANKVKGIIIGEGPLKEDLYSDIKKNNLEDTVSILSERRDVEKIASMSDIFLLPSIYEGLPIVGVEMQSNGMLCFFSSNVDDAVQITDKAFLVDINNSPSHLAKYILSKNENNSLLNRQKYNMLVNEKGHSVDNTVKSILELYEKK